MQLDLSFLFGSKIKEIQDFFLTSSYHESISIKTNGFEFRLRNSVGLIPKSDKSENSLELWVLQNDKIPHRFNGAKLDFSEDFLRSIFGSHNVLHVLKIKFWSLDFTKWTDHNRSTGSTFEINLKPNSIQLEIEFNGLKTNVLRTRGAAKTLDISYCVLDILSVRGNYNQLSIGTNKPLHLHEAEENYIIIDDVRAENLDVRLNREYQYVHVGNNFASKITCSLNQCSALGIISTTFKNAIISGNIVDELTIENLGTIILTSPSDLRIETNTIKKHLILSDINFSKRQPSLKTNFTLGKTATRLQMDYRNSINKIVARNLAWSYENILASHSFQDFKLSTILKLKYAYELEGDTKQVRMFRAFEKRWHNENGRFDFALRFGWISNRYGLSLLTPFCWILSLIFLEVVILALMSWNCMDYYLQNWGLILHLLNPAHSTESLFGLIKDCPSFGSIKNWVYLLDNFFRILIGYAIYQFVTAFRYLYDLK